MADKKKEIKPATEKQVAYVKYLAVEAKKKFKRFPFVETENLGMSNAMRWIDFLQELLGIEAVQQSKPGETDYKAIGKQVIAEKKAEVAQETGQAMKEAIAEEQLPEELLKDIEEKAVQELVSDNQAELVKAATEASVAFAKIAEVA